jgi:uncharacterized protein (DUF1330 family)
VITPETKLTALTDAEVLIVFDLLAKWIKQRPGLDFANYGDMKSFSAEARTIQQQKRRAESALLQAKNFEPNGAALLDALRSGFSGRLDVRREDSGALSLEYCTGQYWPTEYRIAAAVVLERYCETVRPKRAPQYRQEWTITDIKEANREAGFHFFDRDSMRFFDSRVHNVYQGLGGVYIVTSEQCHMAGRSEPRRFTVRQFQTATADLDTIGSFQGYSDIHDARNEAKRLARSQATAAA